MGTCKRCKSALLGHPKTSRVQIHGPLGGKTAFYYLGTGIPGKNPANNRQKPGSGKTEPTRPIVDGGARAVQHAASTVGVMPTQPDDRKLPFIDWWPTRGESVAQGIFLRSKINIH